MKLMHYTDTPLKFDPDRTYEQRPPGDFTKPVGLWVSVEGEDDWPSWCRGEDFCVGSLTCAHQVTLNPDATILHISSGVEIEKFHDIYAMPSEFHRGRGFAYGGEKDYWGIDWNRVSTECDGIIIAPYLWSHRLSGAVNWYYGWDCASGCIWNLSAIDSIELIAEL